MKSRHIPGNKSTNSIIKSDAYYQMLHVRRSESGNYRDSVAYKEKMNDMQKAQMEFAKRVFGDPDN